MTRVVVIGSGIDELVAAQYLSLGGHNVALVRRQGELQENMLDAGWIPPAIVRDLDLRRHGLEIHEADPLAAALPAGGTLELTRDVPRSAEAIRRLSAADAGAWLEFCSRMHALARVLETLYRAPPPDPLAKALTGLGAFAQTAFRIRRLGRDRMRDLFRLATMSAADLLDDWFESDALKGLLGGAAILHLAQGPRSGGTAFNLLHHHVGSPPGVFRPPLTNIREALRRRSEVHVREAAPARIEVRGGRVASVVLESGEMLDAAAVVSGLTPQRTLLELVDPGLLDPELVRAIRNIRSRGVASRISLTLDRAPGFTTLVIAPSLDALERAYDDVKYGRLSADPYIEARYVGQRAGGRHRVELHVQYVPHAGAGADWDSDASNKFARCVIAKVDERVRGFADAVIEQHVFTPRDLERIEGCPEGQVYDAEIALDQVLWMRPVPALAQYRTPIGGLYLCGPAMHPGGGVSGAAGANAASVILRELKRRKE